MATGPSSPPPFIITEDVITFFNVGITTSLEEMNFNAALEANPPTLDVFGTDAELINEFAYPIISEGNHRASSAILLFGNVADNPEARMVFKFDGVAEVEELQPGFIVKMTMSSRRNPVYLDAKQDGSSGTMSYFLMTFVDPDIEKLDHRRKDIAQEEDKDQEEFISERELRFDFPTTRNQTQRDKANALFLTYLGV